MRVLFPGNDLLVSLVARVSGQAPVVGNGAVHI
jgi:hypothetical protein